MCFLEKQQVDEMKVIVVSLKLMEKDIWGGWWSWTLMCQVPAMRVDAPSPRSMRCEQLEAEGSMRLLYLWCNTRLPNWADSVTWGWKWLKRAQSSLGSSVGRGRRDWRLRGEESEGNATEMRGIGRELTENWGNYWGALPSDWKFAITNYRLTLNTIYLVRAL